MYCMIIAGAQRGHGQPHEIEKAAPSIEKMNEVNMTLQRNDLLPACCWTIWPIGGAGVGSCELHYSERW